MRSKRQLTILTILLPSILSVLAGTLAVLPPLHLPSTPPDSTVVKAQPVLTEDEDIPYSLLNPRWKVQRTTPVTQEDLDRGVLDLQQPDNLKQEVIYNDTINRYVIGSKIGDTYINAPIMMTPEEYRKWSEKQAFNAFFKSKNEEVTKNKGKDKFDFTDMHFDLGPAEKIFGPGGVRIKTQGTAELRFGATLKNIDNPSLPIRNRKTTTMVFDEKINLNVNCKVCDKVNMNLNSSSSSKPATHPSRAILRSSEVPVRFSACVPTCSSAGSSSKPSSRRRNHRRRASRHGAACSSRHSKSTLPTMRTTVTSSSRSISAIPTTRP